MAETKTFVAGSPTWVDISSKDPAGSREYYGKLFGWETEVMTDPQFGGYGMAKISGKDVAGIGGLQDPNAPSAWMLYIGTDDAEAIAKKVEAAGGKVVAPPFDVGESGRMAVFQDPVGAYISVWQPKDMPGAAVMHEPGSFAWAELNARGIEKAKPFYTQVFGWGEKVSPMGEGTPPYTEFQVDGKSIAGGMEMVAMVPAEVPSHWMVYFAVDDVDQAFAKATAIGGRELLAPQDFPGGRFALLQDPQGAAFGVLKMER
jgi:predicted enzyme related to lactoylglutathione lyase